MSNPSIQQLIETVRDPTTSEHDVRKSIYGYAAGVWAQEGHRMFEAYLRQKEQQTQQQRQQSQFQQQNMMKNQAYAGMVAQQ